MQRQTYWARRRIVGVLPLMLVIAGPILTAESPPAERREATDFVTRALKAETAGENPRRDALLDLALEAAPDYPPARWNSGYVRSDNRWVKFDEVSSSATESQRLAVYQRLRGSFRDTVEDQMALAKWCKTAGLQDQWRAHLGNVLALNPDHQEARTMLSYKRVDGVWLTPQEIAGANTRAAAAVAALNKWKPKLLAIRNGLKQSNPNAQAVARKQLAEVQDAAAIPALELVFCGDTEPMARVGVEKFAEMTANDASLALARQALFSRWEAVRKAAAENLKTRDRETYVPELLSAMASPMQSRMELFQEPDGRLLYRHAFYRPGQERDELLVLDTLYSNTFAPSDVIPISSSGNARPIPAIYPDGRRAILLPNGKVQPVGPQSAYDRALTPNPSQGMARVAVAAYASEQQYSDRILAPANPAAAAAAAQAQAAGSAIATAQARQAAVAIQNIQTIALNRAICQLLSETTGEYRPQSPEAWSEWWADTDEVYVPGYKPLTAAYAETDQSQVTAVPAVSIQEQEAATPIHVHYSCLAAGTPILTDTGPVAVEKIKVGDRVLSQDAETGELAYKPVLHTTVRLNAELVKLELFDGTITCSVGHRFWISGKGWMKARDIEPNMNFHGVEGTTPLRRSEPAGVGPVYNLIVADFHSYFVGKALSLQPRHYRPQTDRSARAGPAAAIRIRKLITVAFRSAKVAFFRGAKGDYATVLRCAQRALRRCKA